MPRTSASQPRKGSGGSTGGSGRGGRGRQASGRNMSGVLRNLSASAGLSDLTRVAADRAAAIASASARAAGKSASHAAGRARAESYRDTARRAGVSETTARRWAAGQQTPKASTEASARDKIQRGLGGAKGALGAMMRLSTGIDVGTVTVAIASGGSKGIETRNIGRVHPGPGVMSEVADLIEAGERDAAADLLGEVVLETYGAGLSGVMTIVDMPDPTEFV